LNLTDRLGRLKRRVFTNIEKYGNTSAASIPIALTEAAECGRLQKGSLIALAAFGAGMTSGAAILEW
jgi:3-oxoacyl-[acyl-carrier-protein] synthase-3